ncbi:hypothetical protein J19TS1_03890 [Heyndrickxia oleronia]|nr:hypothetical protein J19TS1_03890 [Heyndrickxia oleronia]
MWPKYWEAGHDTKEHQQEHSQANSEYSCDVHLANKNIYATSHIYYYHHSLSVKTINQNPSY